ncbi:DUF6518 family protein [Streptomyces sp. NPDC057235]|uniref:DUF6518 family protein n=1 Tax=Streptomyces sp. NPDC057235 TaxID=3346058 RepID=UPI0036448599
MSVSGTGGRARILTVVSALVGGPLLGVPADPAREWPPGAWNQIPRSGAVRSVAAFVAGAAVARRVGPPVAAVAGLCAGAGLVIGSHGSAQVARDGTGSLSAPLVADPVAAPRPTRAPPVSPSGASGGSAPRAAPGRRPRRRPCGRGRRGGR